VDESGLFLSELLRANPSWEVPLLFFILVSLSMLFYGVGALILNFAMKTSLNK